MIKKICFLVLSAFFAGGAILWFWVAYTESRPELARAAFQIALLPTILAFLFADEARRTRKPNQQ